MNPLQLTLTVALSLLFAPLFLWWGLWLCFALLAAISRNSQKSPAPFAQTPVTIDILIPAHDEELLLPRLLETLRRQTAPHRIGRTLVIADHCSDRTASLARAAHADVLERSTGPRGKPAALRDGLATLAQLAAPTASRAVLILDADCTVSPNLIEQCALALDHGASVVQASYILDENHTLRTPGQRLHSAAAIAFALKNAIRPKGMAALGIPTQLFGTGMCFRTDALALVHFSDHLTEDLALSYDLLLAGVAPRFLPQADVRSPLPTDTSAMTTQKLRWETGQLHTWSKLPAILLRLISRRPNGWLRGSVAVIDWSAPPVAMAVVYWVGVTFASTVATMTGWVSPWVMLLPALSLALLAAYVIVGGIQIAGIAAVGRLALSVPRFFFWKLALYVRMISGRGPRSWQRTPRGVPTIPGGPQS